MKINLSTVTDAGCPQSGETPCYARLNGISLIIGVLIKMKLRTISLFLGLTAMLYCAFVQAEPVQFNLTDLQGKSHTVKTYAGKWLVVNYWATWCPPCLDEIPELVEFHDKYKNKGAVVLGIDFEDVDKKYLQEFLEQNFVSYPITPVKPSSRGPFGPIYGLPTTFLVSPAGEVVASKTGGVTLKDLEDSIAYFKQQLEKKNGSGEK